MDAEKIALGSRAPDFCLPGLNGEAVCLHDALGTPIVLFFMRAFE
jgi:peroxiredoxin